MASWVDVSRPAHDFFAQACAYAERIRGAEPEAAVTSMEASIAAHQPVTVDANVARADALVEVIASDPSVATVRELARRTGMALRTLQRLFHDWVGLSAKAVIRRYRLQEAAVRASAGPVDWAMLAQQLGYCDQPHLIRDFTATIGTSPARFAARTTG